MDYRYIVVEGAIGSGKGALSRKLAQYFDARLMIEPDNNPFLLPFYLNRARHGLALQLHYLHERSRFMQSLRAEVCKEERIICDFLLEKDQIFAPLAILDHHELDLYWKIRARIMPEIIRPDLVIYLQYSADLEKSRLTSRQKDERNIFPAGYLQEVKKEYDHFFYLYNEVPLLIVNIDEIDLINNDEHFSLLLATLNHWKGKRNYLNVCE